MCNHIIYIYIYMYIYVYIYDIYTHIYIHICVYMYIFRNCALPPTLFSFIEVFGARVGDLRRQQAVHFGALDRYH